ncbi:MAG: hypothetical protein NZ601_03200 [candidate division WOR-3 bacterium]|nr:hypothetical protein [candidate division WOR-3 bacterium]MCX7757837.1 hypothetical protein [candidate division WOR-3 bacterium]MDW7988076.1 hypothetical protein [candidate division WOR-3 bacterium]
MCCDVCPYYEDCEETGKTTNECCPDCPDYENCVGSEDIDEDWDDYN